MTYFIGAALLGYLLGSIPFGLILTKLAGHGDIRSIGSGNIGATNVLRTGNKKLAIITLLLDMAKGAAAIYIMPLVFDASDPEIAQYWIYMLIGAGYFALLGHVFPVWLKFKGGKGVATGLGVLLALVPPAGLAVVVTWLLMAVMFRISSLAALVAVALSPVYAYAFSGGMELVWFCCAVAVLIITKHHANIRRLFKGEEPKIGKGKEKKDE